MAKIPYERVEGSAPFNLALNTLERLAAIIEKLCIISVSIHDINNADDVNLQHAKFGLLKQLFIQSTPLLQDSVRKTIKTEMDKIKLGFPQPQHDQHGRSIGNKIKFDIKADELMDKIEILIQEELQKEKYFMPPKDDPRHSWRQ